MGVIHKLKPEVLSFIIENKQNNPALSCRSLTAMVFQQLQIKVSKSSVNAVFKENNLSMPIGRRPKDKKKKFRMPDLPVIETAKHNRLGDSTKIVTQERIKEPGEEKFLPEEGLIGQDEASKLAQEEARKLAEEKAAQEAQEKKKQEDELRRLAEEKAAAELSKIKALEETRARELARIAQELAEEKKKREEEVHRLEEEQAAREAELKAEKERLVQLAQEEARKLAEEKAALEAARIKAQEEARIRELERVAREEEARRKLEEEARKLAEEKAALEAARIKALEEKTAQEAQEKKKQEDELRRLAEEKAALEAAREAELKAEKERLAKLAQEEAIRLAEEKAAAELAKIKALEEARARELEAARLKAQEETKARDLEEAERLKAAAVAREQEIEKIAKEAEEKKKREEEARKLEEEKLAEETGLKAEREKWARLAQEEQRSKQQAKQPEPIKEEPVLSPSPPVTPEILPEDRVCSGAVILKALDSLIGGTQEINALISRATEGNPQDTQLLTEALIFKSIFTKDIFSTLGDLVGVQYSPEKINSYYAQIKQITDIGTDVARIITNLFTEAKGIKLHFADGSMIHLDGQLYSTWPGTRFPYDFSNTVNDLKSNLNRHCVKGEPLVLFSPPGYDIFPKDFFSLLLNVGFRKIYPDSIILFGHQSEDLETIALDSSFTCSLVFGLWPWQFTSSRKVKKIGDFYLKYIKEIDRDLYLGEIEIELFRASLNQSIILKGCAVKTDLKEKIRLVILNTDQQQLALEELAGIYLSRWPNFEESFQDFSRKIELFTYSSAEQKVFPRDSFGLDTAGITKELSDIFATYIKMLDTYLRWHFLPAEYQEKDFSSTSDYFYKIPVKLVGSAKKLKARTLVSQEYQFLKDLEYLNCRLNERKINTAAGKIFWFESAFK